jgi:hypothetical protein
MKRDEYDSWLEFLGAAAVAQFVRQPDVPLSVVAHAGLLALLYYFGSYQLQMRQQEAEVASSLRATSMASTAKRLRDLETIKQLLEKSANRVETEPAEQNPTSLATPETPEEMVERARDLSQAIDALDREIRAEELAELLGDPKPPPPPDALKPADESTPLVTEIPSTKDTEPAPVAPTITAEMAASEVAALEVKARETLARRQMRLEAKANGMQVKGDITAPREGSTGGSAVSAEIADFMGTGEYGEHIGWSSTGASGIADFSSGAFQVPPVDANGLVRGRGRMFGPGGEYANRIYLNSWYIIGPFPARIRSGRFDNPAYPPEKAVLLDAVYVGKGGRLLKWRYVSSQNYPLVPPDATANAVYYGYTEVSVDEDCDLTAWIGTDYDAQIYLNDRLVWRGGNVNKMAYFYAVYWAPDRTHFQDYNLTEGRRVFHFKKGRNKIFFKLSNESQGVNLSLVLTR